MPALVKSRVGSFEGSSEELCTWRCPFWTKKSRNMRRTSFPVGIGKDDFSIPAFVPFPGLEFRFGIWPNPPVRGSVFDQKGNACADVPLVTVPGLLGGKNLATD